MSRSPHHCSKRVENSLLRYTGEALHAAGVHLSPRSVSIGRCNINGPNKNGLLSRDSLSKSRYEDEGLRFRSPPACDS